MATYADREAFIPFQRDDLIELCIRDGGLNADQVERFRNFCNLLQAFIHYRFHDRLEELKRAFRPFNPDLETQALDEASGEQIATAERTLLDGFQHLLKEANYRALSQEELNQALSEESPLVSVHTQVDMEEFEHLLFFYRGLAPKSIKLKKWIFFSKEIELESLGRVVLLARFKDAQQLKALRKNPKKMPFEPGKLYLYLFKDVPLLDLELLFPNVRIGMNPRDKLLLGIPALGAGIATLVKILPSIGLIIGIILWVMGAQNSAESLGVNFDSIQESLPILLAAISAGAALGGFAMMQYLKFTNKRLNFQKEVTETLFFKNLVSNEGVLYSLVDAAEEEELKEIILVYYHLLVSGPMQREALDDHIEGWMQERFGQRIDFDIDKGLENLKAMSAPLGEGAEQQEIPLLREEADGLLSVRPLDEACSVIDYVWDNIFDATSALRSGIEAQR